MRSRIIHFTALCGFAILAACGGETAKSPEQVKPETVTAQNNVPEMTTTSSGLKYVDLVVGSGREAARGDDVDVRFNAWIYENGARGELFDTSVGSRPFTLTIGLTHASKSWTEGFAGMKIGGKRRLIVPPDPGSSSRDIPPAKSGNRPRVPPNSSLEYEVELLDSAGHFDLGGACVLPGFGSLGLTGKQEDEFKSTGQWDALIDGARRSVRNDCLVPYRWEKLFSALVAGHRYEEAVQVMNDMAMRRFPLKHTLISKADPKFLGSEQFKNSEFETEYVAEESRIRKSIEMAENSLLMMPQNERPPNPYRAVGACPFECCTYRDWKTKSAIQLRESIESPRIVAEIPEGVTVQAVTGEVRIEPAPYAVLRDFGDLKAGDVIFFLDNVGEGHVNYWYKGGRNPLLSFDEGLYSFADENCSSNDRTEGTCSLRKLRPEKKVLNEWWVKIRSSAGQEGWVLNNGQFSNMDACG